AGPGAEAARARDGDAAPRLGRDPVLPRRRQAAHVRLGRRQRRDRGPDRLAVPARLPEDPPLYLSRPGAGSARGWVPYHPVEDSARLRGSFRQGLPARDADPSELSVVEAYRLHLSDDR